MNGIVEASSSAIILFIIILFIQLVFIYDLIYDLSTPMTSLSVIYELLILIG